MTHNSIIIDIVSVLNDLEYVYVRDMDIFKDMWDKLMKVHECDEHVLKDKTENLKGKYDDAIWWKHYSLQYKDKRDHFYYQRHSAFPTLFL